jgi:cysteinyl-tRNA synthetase
VGAAWIISITTIPNEIAQSEAAEGVKMANFWLHGEFMTVEGRRMASPRAIYVSLDDLIKRGYEPLRFGISA